MTDLDQTNGFTKALREAVIRVQSEPIPSSHLHLKNDVLMWIAEADRILVCIESEPDSAA